MPFASRLFAGVLLAALSACGGGGGGGGSSGGPPVDPDTVTFRSYLSPTYQVYADVPSTWLRAEDASDPDLIAFFSEPFRGDSDEVAESVFLYRSAVGDTRPEDISNIELISTRAITVDGIAAVEEIYDAQVEDSGDIDVRFMQVSVPWNGSITGLLYVAERSQFDRLLAVAREMASRMRLGHALFTGTETSSDLSLPGEPAIASDGHNFLVVSCRRSATFPYPVALMGRIVSEGRTLGTEFSLDTPGYPISFCGSASYEAVFDGTQYWITYVQSSDDPASYVAARRVSVDGTVLDTVPIKISQNTTGFPIDPTVAFDGTRLLVVWSESGESASAIRGAFLSSNGVPTAPFDIASDLNTAYARPFVQATPQVSFGSGSYLVIWSPRFFYDTREPPMPIYAQLVGTDGALALPQPLQIRSDADAVANPRYPRVAFDGTRYLVAWIEGELHPNFINQGTFSIRARPVSATGELIDGPASTAGTLIAAPLMASIGSSEVPKEFLKLQFRNGKYHFYWASNNYTPETGMYRASASQDLTQIEGPNPVVASRDAVLDPGGGFQFSEPSVASGSTTSLVVWPTRFGIVEGWYED